MVHAIYSWASLDIIIVENMAIKNHNNLDLERIRGIPMIWMFLD